MSRPDSPGNALVITEKTTIGATFRQGGCTDDAAGTILHAVLGLRPAHVGARPARTDGVEEAGDGVEGGLGDAIGEPAAGYIPELPQHRGDIDYSTEAGSIHVRQQACRHQHC